MMIVELGELILRDRPDPAYAGWGFSRIEGWYGIAPSKNGVDERAQGHGAFGMGAIYRSAKTMTLAAFCQCLDARQASARKAYLNGLAGSNATLLMRVTDEHSSTWREVSILEVDIPETSRPTFTFEIDLIAVDPRRFEDPNDDTTGLPTESGGLEFPFTFPVDFHEIGDLGRITLSNPGTADAFPRLVVSGGLSEGFLAEEVGTGRVVELARPILIGSEVTVDFRTGTAVVDDQASVTGLLVRRDWWSVPPGGSTTIQFTARGAGFGTPLLRGELAPAYW